MKIIVVALLLTAFGGTGLAFFQTHPKTHKAAKHKTKGGHRHRFRHKKRQP